MKLIKSLWSLFSHEPQVVPTGRQTKHTGREERATNGESWRTNPTSGCDYKVYKWTGNLPEHWVKAPHYVGKDRRKKPRIATWLTA